MAENPLRYEKIDKLILVECVKQGDNRMSAAQLSVELADLCEVISFDEEARVVVLAFPGDMFASEPIPDEWEQSIALPFEESIGALKQPVIAAIVGDAVGVGLELALTCDIRIGDESARFGLPYIRGGNMPCNGGTQRLPRIIGLARALEMILTGESIDAGEALRTGLVNRIVARDRIIATGIELAKEMAQKSPLATSYLKEALHQGMDLTLDQGLRMELDLYLLLFSTRDRVEGITAFQQKRKPNFKGE